MTIGLWFFLGYLFAFAVGFAVGHVVGRERRELTRTSERVVARRECDCTIMACEHQR
jgi:hypothetical protein